MAFCGRLSGRHQFFQAPSQPLHGELVHVHGVADHLNGLVAVVILPHGLGDGVEPHHFFKAAVEAVEPGQAGLGVVAVVVGAAPHPGQLRGGHGGISHHDDLVVPAEVVDDPLGLHRLPIHAPGTGVELRVPAVVEVEDFQVLKVVGPVHRLEELAAQTGIGGHGPAGVEEDHDFNVIGPGPVKLQLEIAGVVAGLVDGPVQVEHVHGPVLAGGHLAQAAEGQLEGPLVQHVVLSEVPEVPLPGHLEGVAVLALAPHPNAGGGVA